MSGLKIKFEADRGPMTPIAERAAALVEFLANQQSIIDGPGGVQGVSAREMITTLFGAIAMIHAKHDRGGARGNPE